MNQKTKNQKYKPGSVKLAPEAQDKLLGKTWNSLDALYEAVSNQDWENGLHRAQFIQATFMRHLSKAIELGNSYEATYKQVAATPDPWPGVSCGVRTVKRYTPSLTGSGVMHQEDLGNGKHRWTILAPVNGAKS